MNRLPELGGEFNALHQVQDYLESVGRILGIVILKIDRDGFIKVLAIRHHLRDTVDERCMPK